MSEEKPDALNVSEDQSPTTDLQCPLDLNDGFQLVEIHEFRDDDGYLHTTLELDCRNPDRFWPTLYLKRVYVNDNGKPSVENQFSFPKDPQFVDDVVQLLRDFPSLPPTASVKHKAHVARLTGIVEGRRGRFEGGDRIGFINWWKGDPTPTVVAVVDPCHLCADLADALEELEQLRRSMD